MLRNIDQGHPASCDKDPQTLLWAGSPSERVKSQLVIRTISKGLNYYVIFIVHIAQCGLDTLDIGQLFNTG